MASAGYRACTAFLRSPIQTGAGNALLPPSQYPMKPKKEIEEEDKGVQMNNKRIFMVERSVSIKKGSLK